MRVRVRRKRGETHGRLEEPRRSYAPLGRQLAPRLAKKFDDEFVDVFRRRHPFHLEGPAVPWHGPYVPPLLAALLWLVDPSSTTGDVSKREEGNVAVQLEHQGAIGSSTSMQVMRALFWRETM